MSLPDPKSATIRASYLRLSGVGRTLAVTCVITPSSPLGKVLQGASVGSTLSYAARPGRWLQAKVIAVG